MSLTNKTPEPKSLESLFNQIADHYDSMNS